ncbi:MAG: hypothetical protein ACRC62_10790 [Microcoleus sp.]
MAKKINPEKKAKQPLSDATLKRIRRLCDDPEWEALACQKLGIQIPEKKIVLCLPK